MVRTSAVVEEEVLQADDDLTDLPPEARPALKKWSSESDSGSLYPGTWVQSLIRQKRAAAGDWRVNVSVEERQMVRSKIREAYRSTCQNFDDLLELCTAMDEEFIHTSAPSRLDYIKKACQFAGSLGQRRDSLGVKGGDRAGGEGDPTPMEGVKNTRDRKNRPDLKKKSKSAK